MRRTLNQYRGAHQREERRVAIFLLMKGVAELGTEWALQALDRARKRLRERPDAEEMLQVGRELDESEERAWSFRLAWESESEKRAALEGTNREVREKYRKLEARAKKKEARAKEEEARAKELEEENEMLKEELAYLMRKRSATESSDEPPPKSPKH